MITNGKRFKHMLMLEIPYVQKISILLFNLHDIQRTPTLMLSQAFELSFSKKANTSYASLVVTSLSTYLTNISGEYNQNLSLCLSTVNTY